MDLLFCAYWEASIGVPLVGPANVPTIRIRRSDTGALVVTDAAMTEVGDGNFQFRYTPAVEGIEYVARADGDPTAVTQVPPGIRYQSGCGDNFAAEVWQNEGLDPANPKTITEVIVGADYDENVDQIQKDVIKAAGVTTLTRS
jgi:hypothetical protein